MNLKRFVKKILVKIRWGGVIKRLGAVSDYSGIHFSGTFVNPQCIYIGKNPVIAKGFVLSAFINDFGHKYSPRLVLGDNFWARDNLSIMCATNIIIGDNCTFAKDIFITDLNHGLDPTTLNYRKNPLEAKEIRIGNGCWLGEKVCIMPGVSIGNKSIIGAGSVVTKNIPDYSIAVGNPCKVIKRWDFEKKMWIKP